MIHLTETKAEMCIRDRFRLARLQISETLISFSSFVWSNSIKTFSIRSIDSFFACYWVYS